MKKPKEYNHLAIEKKWQKEWAAKKVYTTEDSSKKKKMYVLDMFPYPSGAGLHVGHPRGYIGSDVYARMKRMQGFNVLHPMGYDAFGLPAEQFAIANKIHPRKAVDVNVATFEKQLSIIGLSYDWSRKVNTTDPAYYKWTQWIFLEIYNSWYDNTKNKARGIDELVSIFGKKGNGNVDAVCDQDTPMFSAHEWKSFSDLDKQKILMKYRLAYEGWSEVNWSPSMGTVLANDEVLDTPNGPVAERDGKPVEKKRMRQWFMRITAYADRLLTGLDALDWNEHIKEIQRNWIGRSEGSEITFKLGGTHLELKRKILIGTRNDAKFRMAKECISQFSDIEFVSLNDIPAIDDSELVEGMDLVENAKMKAEFYFKKTGIPTVSMDNVFWSEKWKKNNGIMVHMRKEANPKSGRATDDEVLAFLKKWTAKVGGSSRSHFIYAFAFANASGTQSFTSTQRDYILQGKKETTKFWPGYPTEALLIDVKTKEFKGDQKNEVRYSELIKDIKHYVPKWFAQPTEVKVFTTRADTLFGVTYVVLAPEHQFVGALLESVSNKAEVEKYIAEVKNKTTIERTAEDKEKTGVPLKGIFAINPANGEQVPVWIADYVLASYGTGAVMAVPAHDERDHAFAKKYGLPTKAVVEEKAVMPPGRDDSVQEGLPFVERTNVAVILRNPKDNTYLCTDWKNVLMHGIVTGGLDEGESLAEAAMREVQEETGYRNMRFVRDPDIAVHTFFFHRIKKINRHARYRFVFLDLVDEERDVIAAHEAEVHTLLWKTPKELEHFFTVLEGTRALTLINNPNYIFTDDGILVNSGTFDGMDSAEARKKITKFVGGKIVTKFKMRDAVFARQRYWGEPIPLIYSKDGLIKPVPTSKLPLTLPNVTSYEPTGTGDSPLAGVKAWMSGGYETNTMPGWAGSSWYFLRYIDPKDTKAFASKKSLDYWFGKKNGGVDMYVGGAEHATGHLLYSRFWHKFLFDKGYVSVDEPFKALRNQGMIGGADGRKMSKRWGNVVNPDDVVKTYGADSLRVFEMFLGPFDSHLPWSTEGIIGSRRFVEKVWRLGQRVKDANAKKTDESAQKILHKTIKKVTEDIALFNFNTAVSAMMICVNEFEKAQELSVADFKLFLQILAPFASHVTEELWYLLGDPASAKATAGKKKSIHISAWPKYNPKKLIEDSVQIAISINGKVRAQLRVSADMSEEEVKAEALKDKAVIPWIENKEIKKIIYVPGRIVNIVV